MRRPSSWLRGLVEDVNRPAGILQVGSLGDETCDRPVETGQQHLPDGPLVIQRLLMPARLVKPDQRRWQVEKGDPSLAGDLRSACGR